MSANVLSKIRCPTDKIKTLELTFPADANPGDFTDIGGTPEVPNIIVMAMHSVDISDDAEGVGMYAAERVRVPTATWHQYTAGDKIYFHGTDDEFTATSANTSLAGFVLQDRAAGGTEIDIEFDGSILQRAIT